MTPVEDDDWRLDRGAHETLAGKFMCKAGYVAPRKEWDHDHCEFCWQKFVDPTYPDRFLEGSEAVKYKEWLSTTDDLMTEAFTNAEPVDGNEPGFHWVCPECFKDFTELAEWSLVDCPGWRTVEVARQMKTPWHRVALPTINLALSLGLAIMAANLGAPGVWILGVVALAIGAYSLLGLYRGIRVVAAARRGEVLSYPPPKWMRRKGAAANAVTWIAALLIVAAGASFVWPVNNPYLSGECVGGRQHGSCPVLWDRVDSGSIWGALIYTAILLAFAAFPLLIRRRYARVVALLPLLVLGFFGVIIFGPVYVPAMLAMLIAAILPDAVERQ